MGKIILESPPRTTQQTKSRLIKKKKLISKKARPAKVTSKSTIRSIPKMLKIKESNAQPTKFDGSNSTLLKDFKFDFDQKKNLYLEKKKSISKSQKKKLEKKERYLRKKHFDDFISKKKNSSSLPSHGNPIQMDDFEKVLMNIEETIPKQNIRLKHLGTASHKLEKIKQKELDHLKLVRNDPNFRTNPLLAVMSHLNNTLPSHNNRLKK